MEWKPKLCSCNLPTEAGRLLQILQWLKWSLKNCHDFEIEDIWLIFFNEAHYCVKLQITLQKQKSYTCGPNVSYFASIIEVKFTRLSIWYFACSILHIVIAYKLVVIPFCHICPRKKVKKRRIIWHVQITFLMYLRSFCGCTGCAMEYTGPEVRSMKNCPCYATDLKFFDCDG